MTAGNVQRAHDLMRLQWDYMLNKNESTHSTFWEGYNADGTFNPFDSGTIYMSNAHGWSTGPASALTAHTVGIRALTLGGLRYVVAPNFGDLSHCQGRLSFGPMRYVDVAWRLEG